MAVKNVYFGDNERDQKAFEKAGSVLPNFSEWVKQKLLEDKSYMEITLRKVLSEYNVSQEKINDEVKKIDDSWC